MATKEQFLREYIKAIRDGNAAVFAGAGLSRPSGFVVWKELLRPLAEDIGLNIDDEYDLTTVAQYVRNQAGNRAVINSSILEAYSKNVKANENVAILTRLPIYTYWTTNYDHLIEEGLRDANRNSDVKIEYKQLSSTKRDRDAVVYKMHGDVDHAADAVLTKDDYVQYDRNYPFFRNVLQGDLISKTFLFIGFSFEDPNLDSILVQIRLLLDENIRNHYCFMKQVIRTDTMSDEDFGYQKARQDLREKDLKRYGIQTVFINEYSEITEILRVIENAILVNNVFISGSADFFVGDWTKARIDELTYKLSNQLVKEEFRVTSGFGLGIGSSVINGALDEIYSSRFKHMDEHLCLRPFPQGIADPDERKLRWKKYREEIFNEVGVAIFIVGNKKDAEGQKAIADGCLQEYQFAKERRIIIIPIGSTGDAAATIYADVKANKSQYPYLEKYLDILGTETNIDKIVNAVMDIIKAQRTVK
ncbi:MAG: SIR2 family protein [Clostridia bacterium]|nr:SIR2 family protein [Clostridia bacterium]